MACYVHDTSGIITECLNSYSNKDLTDSFTKIHTYLCEYGLTPKVHLLDNGYPSGLTHSLKNNEIEFQLVPPYDH